MRMSKIYAPKLCGIAKLLRHIIYDRNKADVEISAPIKIYVPNVCVHQEIGAQTLTIWARQNLQLLTSSKSGWRALVQVMLPLLHVVLKWSEHPGRPAYGRRLSRTVPAVVPARLAKISASCPNICGRIYFHHFLGKSQKSISASKCPITAPKVCIWSQKLSKFSCNTFEPLNGGRPRFWPRSPEIANFQQWGVRGWGGGLIVHKLAALLLSHLKREWGGGGG